MSKPSNSLPVVGQMPTTRGECKHGPRPCPWVNCRHHLGSLNLDEGRLHRATPQAVQEHSCVLDVADENPDGIPLEQVANMFGITRERVRQIEAKALRRLRESATKEELRPIDGIDPEKLVAATLLLRSMLLDGPRRANSVRSSMLIKGYPGPYYRRARSLLKIRTRSRLGFFWLELPEDDGCG